MFPWRRILVPTDFSTAAKWAFDDAIRASAKTGAELLILHVRIPEETGELRFDPSVYDYVEQHELQVLKRHAAAANANIPTRLIVKVSADPAEAILQSALEEDVDLIVLATHARHHVAHLLIGSTTLRVLGSCSVPVLAVRYGTRRRHDSRAIAVLGGSKVALDLATQISEHESASLQILDDVSEADADLIVIPSDCTPEGILAKSGEEIVRHADAPVLLVPGR